MPFPSPGDLPHPVIEPVPSALAGGFFTAEPLGKPTLGSILSPLHRCSPHRRGNRPGTLPRVTQLIFLLKSHSPSTDALSLFPALRSAWWSSKGPERPPDRAWTRIGAGPRILALGDATEAGGRHLVVLCTHHNPGTQGSGSELGERAWAGCLGWSRGDSVCAGISLRDTPGPFPRRHWCWLPKTVHPPPAQTDKLLSKPTFSAPPLVFTLAVPWAWHPLSFLCTKLLLMPQGPAQMSSPPACGMSAAIELPSIRHRGDPSSSLSEGLLPCPTHTPQRLSWLA